VFHSREMIDLLGRKSILRWLPPRFAFCEVAPSGAKQVTRVGSMFAVRVLVEIVQILPNFD
jgi:hypothetical protein